MSNPVQLAGEKFQQSYSCSQSILMAFSPQFGFSQDLAAKIGSPFGGGIARTGKTCGAVSGALMILGLKFGKEDNSSKEMVYQISEDFLNQFIKEYDSIQCKHLIGYDLSNEEELQSARESNVIKSYCTGVVNRAAEILSTVIDSSD